MSNVLNIRMQEGTLKQTERLMDRFGAPSKSDVIRRAIELSDALSSAIEHGDKIIVEGKRGERRQIILPGLINAR